MSELEKLVQDAVSAVSRLNEFFVRTKVGYYWQSAYVEVQDSLNRYDLDLAISLEERIPKSGMGGLLDIYICEENGHATNDPEVDNFELERLINDVAKAFTSLRKILKYA
jgi:hypothetical protein